MPFYQDAEIAEFANFLLSEFGGEKAYQAARAVMREARLLRDHHA